MTNLDNLPELLRPDEAAAYLRVTQLTLKKWEKNGDIQSVRINSRGHRRYQKSEIVKLLK